VSTASVAAGNRTGATGSHNMTYNNADQGTAVDGNTIDYADQGNDLVVGVNSTLLSNGPLGVTAETTSGGTTYYTRDPEGALIDQRTTSGSTNYYFANNLGSVTALIASNDKSTSGTYNYTAYGANTNSASLTATAQGNLWRYAAGYTIGGLTHLGARYYDSNVLSWTQRDSVRGNIAAPRSIGGYTYAAGDPVNRADPSGAFSSASTYLSSCGAGALGGALTGAAVGGVQGLAVGGLGAGPGALGALLRGWSQAAASDLRANLRRTSLAHLP
jgi:RHS repeat-associated protein